MTYQPDIYVQDAHGNIVLLVEVKAKLNTSSDWAAKLRRNLMVHLELPSSPYFLIALPDRFYLWNKQSHDSGIIQPAYIIDSFAFLKPYFEKSNVSFDHITGLGFEMIISWFLQDISKYSPDTILKDNNLNWLAKSGLFEAITGGYIMEGSNLEIFSYHTPLKNKILS